MKTVFRLRFLFPFAAAVALWAPPAFGDGAGETCPTDALVDAAPTSSLERARDLARKGDVAEALDAYRAALASSNGVPSGSVGELENHVVQAVGLLQQLNRGEETEAFLDEVLAAHPFLPSEVWDCNEDGCESFVDGLETAPVRIAVASAFRFLPRHGSFVSGVFKRGTWTGDRQGTCDEHDRVRALRALAEIIPFAEALDPPVRTAFWRAVAATLEDRRTGVFAWRLGELTDLTAVPEPEEGWGERDAGRAPVGPDGAPVFHALPAAWAAAASDGERWRWALERLAETDPEGAARARMRYAAQQFGSATLTPFEREALDLPSLADDETVARLATGVRRFRLPDDYNPVAIAAGRPGLADELGSWFESRGQLERAAEAYRSLPKDHPLRATALSGILDPWVAPEIGAGFTPEKPVSFDVRFRNATNAVFELRPVDRDAMAAALEKLVTSDPGRPVEWWETLLDDESAFRFGDATNFVAERPVASWSMALEPAPGHADAVARASSPAPLPAGVYLLAARADGGNTVHALVDVCDAALLFAPPNRPAPAGSLSLLAADARDGRPLADADVRLLQWWRPEATNWIHRISTARTDGDGTAVLPFLHEAQGRILNGWAGESLVAATCADGRRILTRNRSAFASFEANRVWTRSSFGWTQPGAPRAFVATDRPAYRPGATVRFKIWTEDASYGPNAGSRWAGARIPVEILDPKGDVVWRDERVADAFGGVDGEFALPADAPLGAYFLRASPGAFDQGAVFRVEEYRKPEFEVTVETPDGPLALGDEAKATVRATLLFGAPVAGGTAKIVVTRTAAADGWAPPGPWDWLYGPGYGLCLYDWDWIPHWGDRFSRRPAGPRFTTAPEQVASLTVPLREDGTAEVSWDTAVAKALYGEDVDQRYDVRVEVADISRRVVAASASVLATAHPFRVRAWAHRPWCHDGDTIELRALVSGAFSPAPPVNDPNHPNDPNDPNDPNHLNHPNHLDDPNHPNHPNDVPPFSASLFRLDPATGAETALGPLPAPRPDPAAPGDSAPSALWRIPAPGRGQYRLAVRATDAAGRAEEASVFLTVLAAGDDPARDLRFAPLELVPDKAEYAPGDVARVALHADRADGWVLVTTRAGTDRAESRWIQLDGKTGEVSLKISEEDRPDVFVEALAFHDGRFRKEVRRLAVPPADKAAKVVVEAVPERMEPGAEAEVVVRVAGPDGAPAESASVALTVYDRAVDQIAGGSNVGPILPFFWGWHHEYGGHYATSLRERWNGASVGGIPLLPGDRAMPGVGFCRADDFPYGDLGLWAGGIERKLNGRDEALGFAWGGDMDGLEEADCFADASMALEGEAVGYGFVGQYRSPMPVGDRLEGAVAPNGGPGAAPAVAIRTNFADTAFWSPSLEPAVEPGVFRARFAMPEDATGWRVRAWAMLPGACVGEGEARVATAKSLLVRPVLPRFLVQGDEATLSAVVHNDTPADVEVVVTFAETNGVLTLPGQDKLHGVGEPEDAAPAGFARDDVSLRVPAHGEARADFPVYALREGEAAVVLTASTMGGGRSVSDGVARTLPVQLRGMRKVEGFCRVLDPGETRAEIRFRVPERRLPEETSFELRVADSLLPALWEAVPWLIEYPHGCTEQTLNRFLPAVLVRKALRDSGRTLEDVAAGGVATNAPARPGAPIARDLPLRRGPVVTDAELDRLVAAGIERLGQMQLADGGWGWFSGSGERAIPHTTATVAHGLLAARAAGVAVPEEMLSRGLAWLSREQARRRDEIAADRSRRRAGSDDALVASVLAEAGAPADAAMLGFLHEDRADLPFYAKALLGLAFDRLGDPRRDDLVRNVRQFLVEDAETRTAHFELRNAGWWWMWYGGDVESQAAGLRLLLRADPRDPAVRGLARYLMANRAHATYWESTRDTALALETLLLYHDLVEAPADEAGKPAVRVLLDGRPLDLPEPGAPLRVPRDLLTSGEHVLSLDRSVPSSDSVNGANPANDANGVNDVNGVNVANSTPLYVSASLANFTLEPRIEAAGLEVKVRRTVSRLVEREASGTGRDASGGVVSQTRAAFDRVPLSDRDAVRSGDLIEVRLDIESKNDYEYVLVEDMKGAGFEAVEALSGYRWQGNLFPYVEWRDNRVCLYLTRLPRGTHSLSYRFRAETPGFFTALPARALGMYAPDDLCANSDSLRLEVSEKENAP